MTSKCGKIMASGMHESSLTCKKISPRRVSARFNTNFNPIPSIGEPRQHREQHSVADKVRAVPNSSKHGAEVVNFYCQLVGRT